MTMTLTPETRPPGSTRHSRGFWVIAGVFLVALAFSTVPTPLYPLYQRQDGFSSFTVTVVFAAYAIGVITALLLAGHVSDWTGRKRILLPGLALEAIAGVLFLVWTALPGLILARFLTGAGVGMITATATAFLLDLHNAHRPGAARTRFEIVSAAVNLGGLAAGTLVAGALAEFVSSPLRTPYEVFLVLLALSAVAVASVPETVTKPAERPGYRPQRPKVAGTDKIAYLVAAIGMFVPFAIFGLFTSLAPSFVAGTLHQSSRFLAGLVVFLVIGMGVTAQILSGLMSPRQRYVLGQIAPTVGLPLLVAGMFLPSLWVFLVGGMIAGAGGGILFKTAVSAVAQIAQPHERGEALAGIFLIGYIGLAVPALGMGLATRTIPATTAVVWFAGAILLLLAGIATLSARLSARLSRHRKS
jgi:MFS family permease